MFIKYVCNIVIYKTFFLFSTYPQVYLLQFLMKSNLFLITNNVQRLFLSVKKNLETNIKRLFIKKNVCFITSDKKK